MELLYNPTLMTEAEIKATFVARQGLVDELLGLVGRQPEGAGVQHVVVIAPRGMGKTTILLMVQFGVGDRNLTARWQVVKFCEESYGINDLADFWLEAVKLLAAETGDMGLLRRGDELRGSYPESDDLHEVAFALVKDWARSHGKRLLLLVDNLDLILEQLGDERDNARLRDVLMNDGTVMLTGTASAFFREARAYEQPLYNFFKIHHLDPLQPAEIRQLLRARAAADEKPDFEDFLEKNPARLRVLEHFTGGNPRLVLMLYRVVMRSEVTEVLHGLEKLLDEVTPYYKAKVESLPPQQRKILDHIARVSGQTWEGTTPTDIARATRLRPNQVSAQLKRLSELGYVRAADLRGRTSWYTLSEPLYALYHQMRFGRAVRQRMQWLVNFMKVWYQAEELGPECERLACAFREHLGGGHAREASEAIRYRRYLVEAMAGTASYSAALEGVIRDCLQLGDTALLTHEILPGTPIEHLSEETLTTLREAACITPEEFKRARSAAAPSAEAQREAEVAAAHGLAAGAFEGARYEEALEHLDRVLALNPGDGLALTVRPLMLIFLGRPVEALASAERAIELKTDHFVVWLTRGVALRILGRNEEALHSLDTVLALAPRPARASARGFYAFVHLLKFSAHVELDQTDLAKQDWGEALRRAEPLEQWRDVLSSALVLAALAGHVQFVRQLIAESGLEEPLFPLVRAVDSLLTGDEALIEKLSPEVRGIVEEIVKKLGPPKQVPAKPPRRRAASGPRQRIRKQLR